MKHNLMSPSQTPNAPRQPAVQLSLRQSARHVDLPLKRQRLIRVIQTTLQHVDIDSPSAIGIACVDVAQSQTLNRQYRQKDKPTNVLSFPADVPEEIVPLLDQRPLGDLVICIPVVIQEAHEQHKTAAAHFEHLIVHGVLHLLGHDHELGDAEADAMEQLEIEILHRLGIPNPYVLKD